MKWFVVESGACTVFEHGTHAANYIAERMNKLGIERSAFCVFFGERYEPNVKSSVYLTQWKP